MWRRTLRLSAVVLIVAAAVVGTADRGWGIGFLLGETKEELKLNYDVAVSESVNVQGARLVEIVLTLADEGRLAPLDAVVFHIPSKVMDANGGRGMDLVVAIDMKKTADGKRVGRVQILRELAERAEITLDTHTMDAKLDPMTRLHHVIPIAKYLKNAPAAGAVAKPPAAAAAAPAAPATERKKD